MSEPEPIMLLGTGRCGSTRLQMALNRVGNIWVWGEHDGMLRSLVAWARHARESGPLRQFSYPFVGQDPQDVARRNATYAAWLCPFTPDDISAAERQAVVDLFSRRLPPGKSRWGFKEIRYGEDSDVPARMLELFPKAKLIHIVRNPRDAIGSTLRAWHPDIFEAGLPEDELAERIRGYLAAQAERWMAVSGGLENLVKANPQSATTVQVERVEDEFPRLLEFLGVRGEHFPEDEGLAMNTAPHTERVDRIIAEQYDEILRQLPELGRLARQLGYAA